MGTVTTESNDYIVILLSVAKKITIYLLPVTDPQLMKGLSCYSILVPAKITFVSLLVNIPLNVVGIIISGHTNNDSNATPFWRPPPKI